MLQRITPAEIRAYLRRQDSKIASATDEVIRSLKKLYADYIARFDSLLLAGVPATSTEIWSIQEAVQTMGQLTTILDEAGLEDVVNGYRQRFISLTKGALEYYELFDLPASLRGIDATALDVLIDFADNGMRLWVEDKLVSPLRTALIQGTIGDRPRSLIVKEISDLAPNLFPAQAEVLVDDTFRRYQRSVRAVKGAELDMNIVQYIGPDDKITRPACRHMLHWKDHGAEAFFYTDEVTCDLHEDLREDPLVAGGGWNCRHNFFPVTLDYAKDEGFVPRADKQKGPQPSD